MTATKKIINNQLAQDFVRRVAGEEAVKVITIYERKGRYVTDEELAQKMKLKVTEVRTILNRLHYRGIACYKKSKNSKTGWYSYTWGIKSKRIAELLMEEMIEKAEKLGVKQQVQSNYSLFACDGGCDMLPFEVAVEYDFRCPECGKTMKAVDAQKILKETEKQMEILKTGIEDIRRTI